MFFRGRSHRGTIEGAPDGRQRVPLANPEKEMPKEEDGENAEKEEGKATQEEQRLEWGRETGLKERSATQDSGRERPQREGNAEGETSASTEGKPQFLDPAACQVSGETWLAEVPGHIRGSITTLFQGGTGKRGLMSIKGKGE
ncbi:hypothetical protein NDU88_001867 [Pleurodeles waltl]|uniref:Uncharacterized protein n=1 Tax=Pleurodeles waltl TaxID=8319 RepID=A0AAV7NBY9_PLEWA|nr:hypothetical protein NDU88_001867 [Pleurodeles waltl]